MKNKSIYHLLFLCFGLLPLSVHAMLKEEKELIPRGVLIFLDDSEGKKGGHLGQGISQALSQKAEAIIVSASLFMNVALHNINPAEWVIKKVNKHLYLLLLVSDLKKNGLYQSALEYTPVIKKASETELLLGLKVNHMQTIDLDPQKFDQTIADYSTATADYFMEAVWNGEQSSLFCINADYVQSTKIPFWSIYINGHGLIRETLAYLSLKDFKKFLVFLNDKITTRLLYYNSCYAAGTNAEILYQDSKSILQATYPFTIMTQAISDVMTWSTQNQNYKRLLDAMIAPELDYYKAAMTIYGDSNIPQVKLPGIPWFSAIENKKNVLPIGAILARSRDPNLPLDVVKYCNGSMPRAILLYAHYIPFELIINKKDEYHNTPKFISMIPGQTLHVFKKISSDTLGTGNFILTLHADNENNDKTFFIGTLHSALETHDYTNVIIQQTSFIYPSPAKTVFYSLNGKYYVRVDEQTDRLMTPEEYDYYYHLVRLLRIRDFSTFANLGNYTEQSKQALDNVLPKEFSDSITYIESIVANNPSTEKTDPLLQETLTTQDILDTLVIRAKEAKSVTVIASIHGTDRQTKSATTYYDVVIDFREGLIPSTYFTVKHEGREAWYMNDKPCNYDYREHYPMTSDKILQQKNSETLLPITATPGEIKKLGTTISSAKKEKDSPLIPKSKASSTTKPIRTKTYSITQNIPPLNGHAVIESIETDYIDSSLYVLWQFSQFQNAPIILIKQLKGQISEELQHIFHIKSPTIVLYDVIIDRTTDNGMLRKTYFTYRGQPYLYEVPLKLTIDSKEMSNFFLDTVMASSGPVYVDEILCQPPYIKSMGDFLAQTTKNLIWIKKATGSFSSIIENYWPLGIDPQVIGRFGPTITMHDIVINPGKKTYSFSYENKFFEYNTENYRSTKRTNDDYMALNKKILQKTFPPATIDRSVPPAKKLEKDYKPLYIKAKSNM